MISNDLRLNKLFLSWLFGAFVHTPEAKNIAIPDKQFCLGIDTGQAIMTDCERQGIAGNCPSNIDCTKCQYYKVEVTHA